VVFIEPKYTDDPIGSGAANDDHPPTALAPGEDFLRRIYRTLISNPKRWKNTMMIVTYDEHGGFYDHVPPLKIKDTAGGKQFNTTGVRVPGFVVSPHVTPGKPFKGKLDHTSILQLLADRFTPGKAYSAEVASRQKQLDPLSGVLVKPPAKKFAPEFAESMGAAMHVAAAAAPVAPSGPGAPKDTETAKAFDKVAHELAAKRPDLLATPHGQMIAAYVAGTALTGGTLPRAAAASLDKAAFAAATATGKRRRAAAKAKRKAKAAVKSARRQSRKRRRS
jgi:phospholipase C